MLFGGCIVNARTSDISRGLRLGGIQIRRVKLNKVFCGFGHLSKQDRTEAINDFPSIAIDLSGDCVAEWRNFVDRLARNFASDTSTIGDNPNSEAFSVPLNFVFDLVRSRHGTLSFSLVRLPIFGGACRSS